MIGNEGSEEDILPQDCDETRMLQLYHGSREKRKARRTNKSRKDNTYVELEFSIDALSTHFCLHIYFIFMMFFFFIHVFQNAPKRYLILRQGVISVFCSYLSGFVVTFDS